MAENCIFCQIVAGKAPAEIVYQDNLVTAFRDQRSAASSGVNGPACGDAAAPVHILIVPNRHITSLNRITEADEALLGHLFIVARKLAEQKAISQDGYRFIVNTGPDAGQTIFHLHAHLMGGRRLPGLTP